MTKKDIPYLIEELLDKEQFDYSIRKTEYAGHAYEIAKESKEQGIDIVVAVGGDGTVNEVGRALVHSNTALGIIPTGSGNGLARHLLIPMKIKGAIQVLNDCEITDLDYGIINEHPFFCTCGVGFDAFISEKFAEAGKRGPITYLENILKEGLKYKPETYEIEAENGTIKKESFPYFVRQCIAIWQQCLYCSTSIDERWYDRCHYYGTIRCPRSFTDKHRNVQ